VPDRLLLGRGKKDVIDGQYGDRADALFNAAGPRVGGSQGLISILDSRAAISNFSWLLRHGVGCRLLAISENFRSALSLGQCTEFWRRWTMKRCHAGPQDYFYIRSAATAGSLRLRAM